MHPIAEKPLRLDPDPQLFQSFSLKTRLDRFIRFALPAWKLPKPAEAIFQMTLSDQEFPVPMNDRAADIKSFGHFTSGQGVWIAYGIIVM